MGFTWDPDERAAFDAELMAHLGAALPGAAFTWEEYHRMLVVTLPSGARAQIWEPNFFFSYPSFSKAHLFGQALDAIRDQLHTPESEHPHDDV